jgi:O-antigen ligase
MFFLGASSVGFVTGIENTERFVWFPAYLAVLALLYRRHDEYLRLMGENAIFVSWALLACLSSLWSLAPGISLYQGLQLFFTIMFALVLLMRVSLQRIQQYLFIALLLTAAVSVVFTILFPDRAFFISGAWKGAFPHKNVFGSVMALLMLTGICLFLQGWRPLFTLSGVIAAAALLVLSRSGASIIAVAAAMAIVPLAMSFRKGPLTFTACVGLLIVATAGVLFLFEVTDNDLIQTALASVGKDDTLTGRTVLWDLGIEAFESRPWLGFGYKGYWEGFGTTASYLRFVIGADLWFFHNNFIEVAVAFGVIGPVLLLGGLIFALVRVVRAFAIDPRPVRLWPILVVVQTASLCMAENPLFTNHGFYQLLLVVAAGSASNGAIRRAETE